MAFSQRRHFQIKTKEKKRGKIEFSLEVDKTISPNLRVFLAGTFNNWQDDNLELTEQREIGTNCAKFYSFFQLPSETLFHFKFILHHPNGNKEWISNNSQVISNLSPNYTNNLIVITNENTTKGGKSFIVVGRKLEANGEASKLLVDRVKFSCDYFNEHSTNKRKDFLVFSGGEVQKCGKNEATIMSDLAQSFGVSSKVIVKENEAKNTVQNVLYSREIIYARKSKEFVVFTSKFHLLRTKLLFLRIFGYLSERLLNDCINSVHSKEQIHNMGEDLLPNGMRVSDLPAFHSFGEVSFVATPDDCFSAAEIDWELEIETKMIKLLPVHLRGIEILEVN